MSFQAYLSTLRIPHPGMFQLLPQVVWKHRITGLFLPVLMSSCAILFGYLAFDESRQILKRGHIWEQGVPTSMTKYRASVRTSFVVWKEHTVYYNFKDHTGKLRKGSDTFDRFFTSVFRGKKPVVRYLQASPETSVLSWSYEARFHGWIFVVLLVMFTLLFTLSLPLVWRISFSGLQELRNLAEKGELRIASILEHHKADSEQDKPECFVFAVQEEEKAKMADPETGEALMLSHTHEVYNNHRLPVLTPDRQALYVLFDPESHDFVVLEESGSPLIWPFQSQ